MKRIFVFTLAVIALLFIISVGKTKVSSQYFKKVESNDTIINTSQNQFAGKVFVAGLEKHFNKKEPCAFYFACGCCSDTLLFVSNTEYYILSHCIPHMDLTKGNYVVTDSLVKIESDGKLISKKYNWELEVDPNAKPRYFIKDTIHKKYAFEFTIDHCNGLMLVSKTKNGDAYIAVESEKKIEDELKMLKDFGFETYLGLE